MSHRRPGTDPMCHYSQAMVVTGTGAGLRDREVGHPFAGSERVRCRALAAPANAPGRREWLPEELIIGQVVPARARVKRSIGCISSSSVPARFPVMSRIVLNPSAHA
jgi:hypothetical protein